MTQSARPAQVVREGRPHGAAALVVIPLLNQVNDWRGSAGVLRAHTHPALQPKFLDVLAAV